MIKTLAKLSVGVVLINCVSTALADSFFMPVKSSVCQNVIPEKSRSDIRFNAYDKAAFIAVKKSEYMQKKAAGLNDHNYDVLSYKLADSALNDVSVITTRDDAEKICLELSGYLNTKKADAVLKEENTKETAPGNIQKIAREVNTLLPMSAEENDTAIPLLYIKNVEFYNHTTTAAYTEKLAQKLSFEPRVLVTENEELADYFIVPKLLQAKMEKIDEDNSRFSMSAVVELQKTGGIVVDSEQQNRYIIISKKEDTQEIAQKLMVKLLEDALDALSGKLNTLLKY